MASPTQWHEFEQILGVGEGQGSLACCSSWGHKKLDTTERLNWTDGVVLILSLCSHPSFSFLLIVIFIISALKSCFLKLTRFLKCLVELSQSSLFLRFFSSGLLFSLFLIFLYCVCFPLILDLSYSSNSKESSCSAGDLSSIPGSERSSGEGNGNPLQYSWLENPMDREARWAIVHRVTKSLTQLSNYYY